MHNCIAVPPVSAGPDFAGRLRWPTCQQVETQEAMLCPEEHTKEPSVSPTTHQSHWHQHSWSLPARTRVRARDPRSRTAARRLIRWTTTLRYTRLTRRNALQNRPAACYTRLAATQQDRQCGLGTHTAPTPPHTQSTQDTCRAQQRHVPTDCMAPSDSRLGCTAKQKTCTEGHRLGGP